MLIPVFIVVAIVAFSILHLIPGSPAALMLGPEFIQRCLINELRNFRKVL